jgi:hypothetical protein
MKLFFLISCFTSFLAITLTAEDLQIFELRSYTAHEGKLEALHQRFNDHTLALFEKHGMTNVIYWVPRDNEANQLIYLLGYPSREARASSWNAFRGDESWKAAYKASTQQGKLVESVDSIFLELTDYSPSILTLKADSSRLYEMRRYTTNSGKLKKLDARFRDHTVKLFTKHGITNLPYFHLTEGQDGQNTTLLYFLSFENEESRNASFEAFSKDQNWVDAKNASQSDGGPILIKKGVASTLLQATHYSPTSR